MDSISSEKRTDCLLTVTHLYDLIHVLLSESDHLRQKNDTSTDSNVPGFFLGRVQSHTVACIYLWMSVILVLGLRRALTQRQTMKDKEREWQWATKRMTEHELCREMIVLFCLPLMRTCTPSPSDGASLRPVEVVIAQRNRWCASQLRTSPASCEKPGSYENQLATQ